MDEAEPVTEPRYVIICGSQQRYFVSEKETDQNALTTTTTKNDTDGQTRDGQLQKHRRLK